MPETPEWFETWFDSPYYHVLYDHRDEEEARQFILRLEDRLHLNESNRVLDLGCGAGRHAAFLAGHVGEVIGVDMSENSIRIATETYDRPNLEFYRHDMRMPFRINYFDYILNFFTSFGYFNKRSDNLKALRSAWKGLRPGGRLLIDFMNAEKAVRELTEREEVIKQGIAFQIRREVHDGRILKHIKFDAEGKVYKFTESVQAFTREDFGKFAGQVGFERVDEFGNYELESFNPLTSPRYIVLLRKPDQPETNGLPTN